MKMDFSIVVFMEKTQLKKHYFERFKGFFVKHFFPNPAFNIRFSHQIR